MNLTLEYKLAKNYASQSQKIRILTEQWVDKQIFCPNCGQLKIDKYENNRPVADFFCSNCKEEYELKSKKDTVGNKILNGCYKTMIDRLQENNNPNFFILNYNLKNYDILNFLVIPKHFFIPEIIEKRQPLHVTARRAGWIGCNILLQSIPESGRIFFIKNHHIKPKNDVLENWKRTLFLRKEKDISTKGWLIDIMRYIERLNKKEFTLNEVYKYEKELEILHPNNRHIKDKIRQQLQFLRDKGYLEFTNRGNYRLI